MKVPHKVSAFVGCSLEKFLEIGDMITISDRNSNEYEENVKKMKKVIKKLKKGKKDDIDEIFDKDEMDFETIERLEHQADDFFSSNPDLAEKYLK